MTKEQKMAEHRARQARLKRVAQSIEESKNSKYQGADYRLGYKFLIGEVIELQREFNNRFTEDILIDPRFPEFYERMIQIMESSDAVLLDSIDPVAERKKVESAAKKE